MKRREREHKEEAIALLEALGVEAVSVTESPKKAP